MEEWTKVNQQAAGRDKIARLAQYACRALWDSLPANDAHGEYVHRLKSLEYILSSFRKLLRFGKFLDLIYASLKTIHNPDVTLRITLTLSKLSQAMFLYADHIVWIARSGVFSKNIRLAEWTTLSNRYWLLSVTMNLCRDAYEWCRIVERSQLKLDDFNRSVVNACSIRTGHDLMKVTLKTYAALHAHQAVFVDTLKNGCDFFIPLTALGYTRLTPRTIGVLGVVSSLAGLVAILKPAAKLVPS